MNTRLNGIVCVGLLLTGPAAHALPVLGVPVNEVTASTNGGVNFSFSDPCTSTLASGSGPQSAGCTSGGATIPFNAISTASAGAGTVRLGTGSAANSVDSTPFYASGSVYGRSVDYFAISGPANGLATLIGNFVLDGNLDVLVGGAPQSGTVALASYSYEAGLTGAAAISRSGQWLLSTNGTDIQSNGTGAVLPVSASFRFGADGWAVFSIAMQAQLHVEGQAKPYLECSSCAQVPGMFSAAANFDHTLYWGGIDAVLVNGVPLTGYGYLASASGVDYRQSTSVVPLPAAFGLFGSGLLGLAGLARRRGQA